MMHTVTCPHRTGEDVMPAFGNFAGALGAGFFPATWLPPSANTTADSLKRGVAMLGMESGHQYGHRIWP